MQPKVDQMKRHYESEDEITNIVRGFESCRTGKDDFPHRDHLALAVWYLRGSDLIAATDSMRNSLHRFLDHHGCRENYHETMTIFWIRVVQEVLESLDEQSLLQQANAVAEHLNDSRVVYDYYSKKLLGSEAARRNWVEPDLRKIGKGVR